MSIHKYYRPPSANIGWKSSIMYNKVLFQLMLMGRGGLTIIGISQNLKFCYVSLISSICNSPFQTWGEVLSSVGLKAEINNNNILSNTSYSIISISVYLFLVTCVTHLYLKKFSYPGVINPNKLVPLLPKKTKFNNSLRAALLMDSYICIQWEFLAFFLAMFAIFRSQHIWQLCPRECLNCFPFNLNSWKYDSNAIPVWNMRRRWDMSEITCRHISQFTSTKKLTFHLLALLTKPNKFL